MNSITIDNNGNVYETGYTQTNGNYDYYTVKYNTDGNLIWSSLYNGPGNASDRAYDIVVNELGDIFITGGSTGSGTNSDYATIKYSILTNTKNKLSTSLQNFILYQNYPNPYNPTTKIKYSLPNTQYTILKVYDILGNEVSTLVNEKQKAGSYSVEFDGTNYPSGIYYYKLISGSFSDVKKMILLK